MKYTFFKLCCGIMLLFIINACTEKKDSVVEEFSTPEQTYRYWMATSEKEDIPNNLRCLTKASKKIMDAQLRQMDVFMARMRANVKIFGTYTVEGQKIKDNKAVVILRGVKGDTIPLPMALEVDGWKIDFVALFGGSG